jgi:hypothetical protein
VEVAKVLELLRVHEDVREEHLLTRFVVQEGVWDTMGTVRGQRGKELDTLQDELVIVV